MRRLLTAVAVVVAAGFPAATADADPLCYRVQRGGSLPPPLDTGLVCVPFVDIATNCQTRRIDTTTLNWVELYFCLPR